MRRLVTHTRTGVEYEIGIKIRNADAKHAPDLDLMRETLHAAAKMLEVGDTAPAEERDDDLHARLQRLEGCLGLMRWSRADGERRDFLGKPVAEQCDILHARTTDILVRLGALEGRRLEDQLANIHFRLEVDE